MARVSATMPIASVATPGRSTWRGAVSSRDSGTNRRIISVAMIENGTLMKNTHRQSRASVSTPPTSGPSAVPSVETATTMPIARGRVSSSKELETMAMLQGKRIAAPTPWTTRAATMVVSSTAIPQSSDARPKRTTPTSSARRRPRMSPMRPPATSSAANDSR